MADTPSAIAYWDYITIRRDTAATPCVPLPATYCSAPRQCFVSDLRALLVAIASVNDPRRRWCRHVTRCGDVHYPNCHARAYDCCMWAQQLFIADLLNHFCSSNGSVFVFILIA